MFETLFLQILGLLFLLAALALGYRLWVRPYRREAGFQSRALLFLIVVTMMGGLIGSPFWWRDDLTSFTWDLPALASRMLAAAGLSFAAVSLLVLRRPTSRRQRLVLVLLAVYLAPLAAAAIAFHLERFDFSAPITYAFFVIVGAMVIQVLWFLWRPPPPVIPARPPFPPSRWVSMWMVFVALVTVLWGLALFWTDSGPLSAVWAWPGDLLTSRLIGVMLLTIAAGAWYTRSDADSAAPMLAMMFVYGVGVAGAGLAHFYAGKPLPAAYVAAFSLVALGSLAAGLQTRLAGSSQKNKTPNG